MGITLQKGHTLVATRMYWNNRNKIKLEFAIGIGKKSHDKRASIKDREWQRQKERIFKVSDK